LGQRSPPCAVQHCFAHCARPISCEGETRLSAGELYLSHRHPISCLLGLLLRSKLFYVVEGTLEH